MNALTATAGRVLPATQIAPPRLSPDLGYAVRRMMEDPAQPPLALPPHLLAEARNSAQRLGNLLGPVDPDTVRRWLLPLNAAVRNPLSAEDFNTRAAAIATAVMDLPGAVFTVPTQREAMATCQFFPSAADIRALLEPHANELRRPLHALRRIAADGSDPAMVRATREQASEGFAKVREAMAEVTGPIEAARPTVPPEALCFSRETLNTLYAQQGLVGPRAPTAQPYRIEVGG